MRRLTANLIILVLVSFLTGCQGIWGSGYQKYSDSFFGNFDTMINVTLYTQNRQQFETYYEEAKERFNELHRLFDIYNEYDGINNIKTINDNAGIKPVKVDSEIIDLIAFAKEWHRRTDGKVNVAMGPVLEILHRYREQGRYHPSDSKLPSEKELQEASKYTDINRVIVDRSRGTVYLEDKEMALDVGAVAKGFAVEIVTKELTQEGLKSGVINAGGNIRVIGKPLDQVRQRWGIAVQDPDKFILTDQDDSFLDVCL